MQSGFHKWPRSLEIVLDIGDHDCSSITMLLCSHYHLDRLWIFDERSSSPPCWAEVTSCVWFFFLMLKTILRRVTRFLPLKKKEKAMHGVISNAFN